MKGLNLNRVTVYKERERESCGETKCERIEHFRGNFEGMKDAVWEKESGVMEEIKRGINYTTSFSLVYNLC